MVYDDENHGGASEEDSERVELAVGNHLGRAIGMLLGGVVREAELAVRSLVRQSLQKTAANTYK
jgi:hypothetical protein